MDAYLGHMATKLQALRRGLVQARLFRHMRSSTVTIQAAWRCAAARRAYLRQRAAAICIQAHCRGFIVQRAYHAARVKYLTLKLYSRDGMAPGEWPEVNCHISHLHRPSHLHCITSAETLISAVSVCSDTSPSPVLSWG